MIILRPIYQRLAQTYGVQRWWPITPVDDRRLPPPHPMTERAAFEIAVGAILTQNTAWTNVEKALINLKRNRFLSPQMLSTVPAGRIASLIRPSGCFRQKAKRLRAFSRWVVAKRGLCRWAQGRPLFTLRSELLSLHGIGPETADSILLYACGRPVFVIDAYTKRLCSQYSIPDFLQHENAPLADHSLQEPQVVQSKVASGYVGELRGSEMLAECRARQEHDFNVLCSIEGRRTHADVVRHYVVIPLHNRPGIIAIPSNEMHLSPIACFLSAVAKSGRNRDRGRPQEIERWMCRPRFPCYSQR